MYEKNDAKDRRFLASFDDSTVPNARFGQIHGTDTTAATTGENHKKHRKYKKPAKCAKVAFCLHGAHVFTKT